ncbi:hypothetical protein KXQ82_12820 [Mucilaginibacter sp. HMF5004]|uniref:hypothetical protein n=1 Tax=Mucilaginibacter rivuli TaxID=2857527 RepID=UPI001C5FEBAC|nr:hypothetical protein [Mucilaginibacter rivuli]MBW4890611.1 hypothetical protein [Mucilaginibacter rivuli]
MKYKYPLLLIIIGSLIWASCKKIPGYSIVPGSSTGNGTSTGTGGVTNGTTYHTSTMYNTGPVRVFSKSGEILDTAIIGRFARRYFTGGGSGSTYLNGYNGPNKQGDFSIQLGAGTAALIMGGGYISTKTKFTGSDIRMTTTDSIIDPLSGNDPLFLYNFKKSLGKYTPTYDMLFSPGQGGNPFSFTVRNYLTDYYATQSGATLLYPLICGTVAVDLTAPGVTGTSSTGFIINNKFSGIGNNGLKTADTVVLQEFNVVLVK